MAEIACLCGSVRIAIEGDAVNQFYCHCDDCQAVSGGAYIGVAIFPGEAVRVLQGDLATYTHKALPRQRCAKCGTQMIAEVPGLGQTGVKANLLPAGMFRPDFHINCRFALMPVKDGLPHFAGFPAVFGGTDERVSW
jgi:hypothetical protein